MLRKAGLLWAQWTIKSLRYPTCLDFLHPVKYHETLATGGAIGTQVWLYLQNLYSRRGRLYLHLRGKELAQPVYWYFMHVFTLTAAICWVYSLFLSLLSVSTLVSSCGNRNLGHTCPEYLPDFGDVGQACCAFPGVSLLCVELREKYKQKS